MCWHMKNYVWPIVKIYNVYYVIIMVLYIVVKLYLYVCKRFFSASSHAIIKKQRRPVNVRTIHNITMWNAMCKRRVFSRLFFIIIILFFSSRFLSFSLPSSSLAVRVRRWWCFWRTNRTENISAPLQRQRWRYKHTYSYTHTHPYTNTCII